MKFHFDKKYLYWGLTAVLVIITGILFYYVLFHRANLSSAIHSFVTISMPIIDGLILAYLMTPIVNTIERKIMKPVCYRYHISVSGKNKKRVRMISIILTIGVVFVVAYEFLSLIIPELIRSIQSIAFQFPIYISNLQDWINHLLENNPDLEALVNEELFKYSDSLNDFLNTTVMPKINGMIISLSTGVIGFLKGMWNLIIGLIFLSIYWAAKKHSQDRRRKLRMLFLIQEQRIRLFQHFALLIRHSAVLSTVKLWIPLLSVSSAFFARISSVRLMRR